jgi:putative oxidoreductase
MQNSTQKLFQTTPQWHLVAARLTLAIILFPHGAQKMLGWFGGYGFSGTMNYFTGAAHLPWIIGLLVIIIEFFAPLFLAAGLAARLWALLVIADMIGIIFKSHLSNGFFMNWFGTQQGEGYEYHLLVIGLAIVVLLGGAGKWSADRKLS